MATEKLVVIKEIELSCNCPECFNQDLKLTFYQKHKYGMFFDKTTHDISNQILCTKCKSDIYPSLWTDDIERIFSYYKKTISPEKSSLKFNNLFYMLLAGGIIVIAIILYLFFADIIAI